MRTLVFDRRPANGAVFVNALEWELYTTSAQDPNTRSSARGRLVPGAGLVELPIDEGADGSVKPHAFGGTLSLSMALGPTTFTSAHGDRRAGFTAHFAGLAVSKAFVGARGATTEPHAFWSAQCPSLSRSSALAGDQPSCLLAPCNPALYQAIVEDAASRALLSCESSPSPLTVYTLLALDSRTLELSVNQRQSFIGFVGSTMGLVLCRPSSPAARLPCAQSSRS